MSALTIRGLTVVLGDVIVLDSLDLDVMSGETVALLGPSGSGKTTLLYAVAGLLAPDSGTVEIGGVEMTPAIGPEDRSIGMVFQNYALWPHLDARATVAYPLVRRGIAHDDAARRAEELLDLVGIGGLGDRLPDQLSGGQQQRVGLARALAAEPALHLFDEPTAHLDAGVRQALQAELVAQRKRTGAAGLYTTHDAAEAMAVADRVAVLRDGRIVQIGTPAEIYDRPGDEWVAALTGPVSVIDALLGDEERGEIDLLLAGFDVRVTGGTSVAPGECRLVVRPDWAMLGGPISGTVEALRFDGPHTDYTIAYDGGRVVIRRAGAPALGIGDSTGWGLTKAWAIA